MIGFSPMPRLFDRLIRMRTPILAPAFRILLVNDDGMVDQNRSEAPVRRLRPSAHIRYYLTPAASDI
jgi:hypothetical protein